MQERIHGTIAQQLDMACRKWPNQAAYLFPDENVRLTFSEVSRTAIQVEKALLAIGVHRKSRIGIWSVNTPEWVMLTFAAARIGALVVPMNTAWRLEELERTSREAGLHALFVMREFREEHFDSLLEELNKRSTTQRGKGCLLISMETQAPEGIISWDAFLALGQEVSEKLRLAQEAEVGEMDEHMIQFTSGTTGKVKGAVLTEYEVLNTAAAFVGRMHLTDRDILCVPLPLFHCYGNCLALLGAILSGCTMVYLSKFSRRRMVAALSDLQCTGMLGVPTMYYALLRDESGKGRTYPNLVKAAAGGAYCPESLARETTKRFGLQSFVIGYGLSESASLCTLSDIRAPEKERFLTVGRPLDGLEVSIEGVNGREDPDAQVGEILVRGFAVMKGYFRDSEETRKAIDSDGWLHTGDIGRRNPDGSFSMVGREKDIIIRGGENICPLEVETAAAAIPGVLQCECVGVPDEKYGEEVAAFLITDGRKSLTKESIRDALEKKIAHYKVPRFIYFTMSFPTNASGKVLKRELVLEAERLQEGIISNN